MDNDHSGVWESDEFEITVTKAIVSLYEEKHRTHKKVNKTLRVTDSEIRYLKNLGLYFPPSDRIVSLDEIDVINDGLPYSAGWAFGNTQQETDPKISFRNDPRLMDGYLQMYWIRRMPFKKKFVRTGPGISYAVYFAYARNEGGLIWARDFVTIDPKDGQIYHTIRQQQFYDWGEHRHHVVEHKPDLIGGRYSTCGSTAACVGFYQDRVQLWNVTAIEGKAKATFGVHESQIQSLFFSRDLPKTKTGRKSPILHWVSAHKRRIKSGIDIDVEKHLRGTDKFEMNGTTFEITRPIKKMNVS